MHHGAHQTSGALRQRQRDLGLPAIDEKPPSQNVVVAFQCSLLLQQLPVAPGSAVGSRAPGGLVAATPLLLAHVRPELPRALNKLTVTIAPDSGLPIGAHALIIEYE